MTSSPNADETPEAFPGNGELYCLFGNPVAQSLSPLMHNAAFARMKIAARFSALKVNDAAEIVRQIREFGIRGASVTTPFKTEVMALLDEAEESAEEIGAVNTIVNRGGRLTGYNTDWLGLARDIEDWIGIRGKTFAILGAGGAARAAVYALRQRGGFPVVIGRTGENARTVAARFGCPWRLLPRSATCGRTS